MEAEQRTHDARGKMCDLQSVVWLKSSTGRLISHAGARMDLSAHTARLNKSIDGPDCSTETESRDSYVAKT